jgi:OHCU decarboxylase
MKRYSLAEVNSLPEEEFVSVIGPVFEHSPWIAEATYSKRPFSSIEDLRGKLCATIKVADDSAKEELIRAHPDLVGRAAQAGTLTSASTNEQASAGLMALTPDEIAKFERYNAEYRQKFGFPFVICARLNKKEAILQAFPVRLQHSREEEMDTALREIFKIADLRLRDLVG